MENRRLLAPLQASSYGAPELQAGMTWLVAPGQAPEVQLVQQGSGEWRLEEWISWPAKIFDRSALRVRKFSKYDFTIL